jgi:hypothetical protein
MVCPESRTIPVPHVPQCRSFRLSSIQSGGARGPKKNPKHCHNPSHRRRRPPAGSMSFPAPWMVTGSLPSWPRRSIVGGDFSISSGEGVAVTRFATQGPSCAISPWICNPSMPPGKTTACRNGCDPARKTSTGGKIKIPIRHSMSRNQKTLLSCKRKGNIPRRKCECFQTLTPPTL